MNDTESCVFVERRFMDLCPNFQRYYRDTGHAVAFDCTSVRNDGAYLVVQAKHQTQGMTKTIWLPTCLVVSVIFDEEDKQVKGFAQ